jgi:proline iminopeptidase
VTTEAKGDSHLERRVELFGRFGGPEVGALARRRFLETHGQDEAMIADWRRLAMPHYTRTRRDPDALNRRVARPEVLHHFSRPGGEGHTFNMLPDLKRVQCPTLVLGGEDDPMTPIESQTDIAAALPQHLVRYERFAGCGHGVVPDAPERGLAVLRDFILNG